MHDINRITITVAVIRSFAGLRTRRQQQLLSALVQHLHDFARETSLSHAEWSDAIDFLVRCGAISGAHRNEFMLLSDVLGLSSLVDMVDAPAGTTESSVLGPFYASDSPERPVGADLRSDRIGPSLLVRGTVQDMQANPIPGALIDLWQTAENGLYATQDPDQPDDALRCKMRCTKAGQFRFTTARPGPYQVPDDGPVGDLLHAGGRTAWRPAHFHFRILAEGYRPVTTEIFFADDQWIDKDAVFGVRASLITAPKREGDAMVVDLAFRLARAEIAADAA